MRGSGSTTTTHTSRGKSRWFVTACAVGLVLALGPGSAPASATPDRGSSSVERTKLASSPGQNSGIWAPSWYQTTSSYKKCVRDVQRQSKWKRASRAARERMIRAKCGKGYGTPTPKPTPKPTPTPTTPSTTTETPPPSDEPNPPTGSPPKGSCAHDPSSCGYPDESNSGVPAGTTLQRVPEDVKSGKGWHYDARGWIEVDGVGATLSGITTTHNVNVTGANATVENSRIIVSGESFGISVRRAANVTLRNNEVSGPKDSGPTRLMVGIKDVYSDSAGLKIIGNDIWNTATGVQTDQGLIEDNYIHDLAFTGDDHVNGTTSNGGKTLLTIRHNTVFNPQTQTDAISLFQDFGAQGNRVIYDNLLAGGGYTIYAGANTGKAATATNIAVTNNRISRIYFPNGGYFGYATAYANSGGNSWTGNIWDDTGATIPRP